MKRLKDILSAAVQGAMRLLKFFAKSRPQYQLRGLGLLLSWQHLMARKSEFRFQEISRLLGSERSGRDQRASEDYAQRAARDVSRVEDRLQQFKRNGDQALLQKGIHYLERAGHSFAANGKQAQAELCLRVVARFRSPNTPEGIDNLRNLAIIQFMLGEVGRAKATFVQMGLAQRFNRVAARTNPDYRFLGRSWFVAIGHVAMIDILLKQRDLGWLGDVKRFVICEDVQNIAGKTILKSFLKHGVELAQSEQGYYDFHRASDEPEWAELTRSERESLIAEFWTYSTPSGESSFFAHGAAEIQAEWEHQQRLPLLKLGRQERDTLGVLLEQLGLPPQAWYVCLHVRESGFHGKWNKTYPSARDANIEDYQAAIAAIVKRGGWVIRMGDASMKPLKPMPGLVDYVQTSHKAEPIDTLLAAGCRFMLGTNSGFSILPATYGAPCVLTNWIPIALPNWYGMDLMIPKLMRSRQSGKLLGFSTMLEDPLGSIQNPRNFPVDIEILENTPDEICEVTTEMLDRLEGVKYSAEDERMHKCYVALAISKGSYQGGRMGREFLKKHDQLLSTAGGDHERG